MADILTMQDLANGQLDVKALGEAANGDENTIVTTRTGNTYPSAERAISIMFQNGGLPAKPFPTLAKMQTDGATLPDNSYAMVTNEQGVNAVNNGLYIKTAGAWIKSGYDPLGQALNYIDSSQTIEDKHAVSEFVNNGYLEHANGVFRSDANYYTTDFISAVPSVEYSYSIMSTASTGGAFYDADKNYISGFGASSTGTLKKTTSPANAYYFRVSSAKTLTNPYITAFGQYNTSKINKLIASYPFKASGLIYNIKPINYPSAGDYLTYQTGVIGKNELSLATTGYVKIEPNTSYEVLSKASGNAGCGWYDKDKVFISGFQPFTKTTVVSPANARYLMLTTSVAEASKSYLKTTDERFNIDKLMSAVNAHFKLSNTDDRSLDNLAARLDIDVAKNKTTLLTVEQILKNPLAFDTIVNSKANLNTVNPSGTSDRAYPIGRRVYDHSLRQEVIADGMFWRLPDGTAASLAPRVYVFPDWDETRKALPTYAKSYKKVMNASTVGVTDFVKVTTDTSATISKTAIYGDNRVLIQHIDAPKVSSWFILQNNNIASLERYFIFDAYTIMEDLFTVRLGLFDVNNTLVAQRTLRTESLGSNVSNDNFSNIKGQVRLKFEVDTKGLILESGRLLSEGVKLGFEVSRQANKTAIFAVSDVENVSFKPMITLRFDDQRKTVYDNAYPVMQQYGLKGFIAVVTGSNHLANDPDYIYGGLATMTKPQLLEVRTSGWDLISHTHTHMDYAGKSDSYVRENYRKSRDYLLKELGTTAIEASCLVAPQGRRDERSAMIQREFFDVHFGAIHRNSHMPRQPEGTWEKGSLWAQMGSFDGDNITSGNDLIAMAQACIDEQRWGVVMMHEVPLTVGSTGWQLDVPKFTAFCEWLNANKDKIDVVTIRDVIKKIRPA